VPVSLDEPVRRVLLRLDGKRMPKEIGCAPATLAWLAQMGLLEEPLHPASYNKGLGARLHPDPRCAGP